MTDESIFTAALNIPDLVRRAEYLNSACADDPARRARVERLLAAHGKAHNFLERPAVGLADPDHAAVRTRHPRIALVRCAAGQNARVCRRHVGMRSDHG